VDFAGQHNSAGWLSLQMQFNSPKYQKLRCAGIIHAQDDSFYRNFTYPNTGTTCWEIKIKES